MAWQGGVVPMITVPESLTQLATQTASTGVPQLLGQVWQGAGQSFFGSAGQALAGGLAGSAVNIALNSAFSTNVVGPQGFSLTSGANILASTITPYVTSSVAAGINQQIGQSLKGAGAFGPILGNLGTQAVNQVFNGITNSIFGAANPGAGGGNATNYKMFPGGGDEPPADYGGSTYTLTDVVFSIQPANQGPQVFGDVSYTDFYLSDTKLPWGTFNGDVFGVGSPDSVDALRGSVMRGNFLGDVISTDGNLS